MAHKSSARQPMLTYADREARVKPVVAQAIRLSNQNNEADANLLLAIASKESSFNARARNKHSTARGLLQFTGTTWLTVVRDFGARHGLGEYAAAIKTDRDGHLSVKTPRLRRAILALRDDPSLQATMALERLNQHRTSLSDHLGHPAQAADLYLLHLLGPTGALHFLDELAQHPDTSSVEAVGAVAKINRGLFVRDGTELSVAEAYSALQKTLEQQSSHQSEQPQPQVVLAISH